MNQKEARDFGYPSVGVPMQIIKTTTWRWGFSFHPTDETGNVVFMPAEHVSPPNAFHRFLQQWLLGIHWRYQEDKPGSF